MTDNREGGILMLLRSRHLAKTDISAGNRSIGRSLVLYWLCMALAMLGCRAAPAERDGRSLPHSAPVWRNGGITAE